MLWRASRSPFEDGGAMKSTRSFMPREALRARLVTAVLVVVGLVAAYVLLPRILSLGGVSHLRSDTFPESFRIAVIADLDQKSKREGKEAWYSIYMTGTLRRKGESYDVSWDTPAELNTGHNEAGRGGELSELVKFHDALYSFDDRTGIMFSVGNSARSDSADAPFLAPKHIFMEGAGETDKGLKVEWATVKDGLLYVGSFGKEYTNNKGEIVHANNLWVCVVTKEGTVSHVNWKPHYDSMRNALGYAHPGYLLHEAVVWSPHHRKWFILPRRVSTTAYDDVSDEKRGSNLIITASHDFKEVSSTNVGIVTPERGFSSVKFLPGSHDSVMIALKSDENAAAGTQQTFIAIYGEVAGSGGSAWKVLMEEAPLPIDRKFEGIEILSTT